MTDTTTDALAAIEPLIGRSDPQQHSPDPVNEPMIRHWCEAMGDINPVYLDPDAAAISVHGGIIAPPTMLQAWTLPGLVGHEPGEDDPSSAVYRLLEEAGFTSVVATDCEQEYVRPLRPGDLLTSQVTVEAVSALKRTQLGDGHFVTTRLTVRDQNDAIVGVQLFKVLKFIPKDPDPTQDAALRSRPNVTRDTAFFFDSAREHRLDFQRCSDCNTLRHPPGPACRTCHSLSWETSESQGIGEVFSYVVMHHPLVPPFAEPYAVAVVELEEGIRLVANLVDISPSEVRIGMPVALRFIEPDDELTLPAFGPPRKEL